MIKSRIILGVAAIFVITAVSLAGCSKATPAPTPTTTPTPKPQLYIIRYSHYNPGTKDSAPQVWGEKVKEMMEAKFPGRVRVDIFPAAQLYATRPGIEAVSSGSIELAVSSDLYLEAYNPVFTMFLVPGVVTSLEAVNEWAYTAARELSEKYLMPSGFRIVGFYQSELTSILSKKEVRSIADLKGLRLRTPASAVFLATAEALGWAPVAIDLSEALTAIQSRLVDGDVSTLTVQWRNKFTKYLPYSTPGLFGTAAQYQYANVNWLNSLPKDIRDYFIQEAAPAGAMAGVELQRSIFAKEEELVNADGCQIVPWSDAAKKDAFDAVLANPKIKAVLDKTDPYWKEKTKTINDKYEANPKQVFDLNKLKGGQWITGPK